VPERQQLYLHQFLKEKPDLNYRNPTVRTYIEQVLDFWLQEGIEGFRFDRTPFLIENNTLPDNPPNPHRHNDTCEDWEFCSLAPAHNVYQSEIVDIVRSWVELCNAHEVATKRTIITIVDAPAYGQDFMHTKTGVTIVENPDLFFSSTIGSVPRAYGH